MDKKGTVVSQGVDIATHTIYSAVHRDNNYRHTLNDDINDINKSLQSLKNAVLQLTNEVSVVDGKACVVELSKHLSYGSPLPTLNAVFTYNGRLVVGKTLYLDSSEKTGYVTVFGTVCDAESSGLDAYDRYIVYDGLRFYAMYDCNNAPQGIKDAFHAEIVTKVAALQQQITNLGNMVIEAEGGDTEKVKVRLSGSVANPSIDVDVEVSQVEIDDEDGMEATNGLVDNFGLSRVVSYLERIIQTKGNTLAIDISNYAEDGKTLPTLNAVFNYRGKLVEGKTVYVYEESGMQDGYYHVFACSHDGEEANYDEYNWFVVYDNRLNFVRLYDISADTYVPSWIREAFLVGVATSVAELKEKVKDLSKPGIIIDGDVNIEAEGGTDDKVKVRLSGTVTEPELSVNVAVSETSADETNGFTATQGLVDSKALMAAVAYLEAKINNGGSGEPPLTKEEMEEYIDSLFTDAK